MNEYTDQSDQTRNLRPTPAAKVAMIIWDDEYSKQDGGSMDFFDSLSEDRKRRCRLVVKELCRPEANSTPEIPLL